MLLVNPPLSFLPPSFFSPSASLSPEIAINDTAGLINVFDFQHGDVISPLCFCQEWSYPAKQAGNLGRQDWFPTCRSNKAVPLGFVVVLARQQSPSACTRHLAVARRAVS